MIAPTKGPSLTQEFLLVAACSIWPPSERRNAAIERAVVSEPQWDRVFRVAARQRVIGLVHDGLQRAHVAVPDTITEAIRTAAHAQLQTNLQFAAEIVRLQRVFEKRKIEVTFFKGIPAAIDIYGDIGIRHTKDLDILVSPGQIAAASAVLNAAGYIRVDPPATIEGARLRTLIWTGKDFIFVHKDRPSLEVELHWRLFNNANYMDRLGEAAQARRYDALDDISLRTFVGDDQFAYLCAHGAVFAWARLKWLADIGALLARNQGQAERLYDAAVERGAGRAAAQALLLCGRFLGSEIPSSLLEKLSRDAKVRTLTQLAITAMTRGGGEIEPYDLHRGLMPMARSPWLLDGTPRFLWGEINTHWIGWNDVIDIPLPAGLQFLYAVLRAPIWLWRRTTKARPGTV